MALVQSRIKIDRFTGGSFPTALFSEQPVFGKNDTMIRILVTIQQPTDAEIGLVLLLLKDLWTGDLPLGGEISIGRGRLQGAIAGLNLKQADKEDPEKWVIENANESLNISGNTERLEKFVDAFIQEIRV